MDNKRRFVKLENMLVSVRRLFRRVLLFSTSLGVGIGVAISLSGCGLLLQGSPSDTIVNALGEQGANFKMPQKLSPTGHWTQMTVVCPYSTALSLPEEFRDYDRARLNDEGRQKLLFLDNDNGGIQEVELSRQVVDFCSGEKLQAVTIYSDQDWKATDINGIWIVSPSS